MYIVLVQLHFARCVTCFTDIARVFDVSILGFTCLSLLLFINYKTVTLLIASVTFPFPLVSRAM